MQKILLLLIMFFSITVSSQIVNIEDRRTTFKDSIGWYERADLNLSWLQNTKEILNIGGAFQLEFQYKKRILLSITKFNYMDIDNSSFVNQGFQHLRYNRLMNKWLTFETFGQVQYNEKILLKLRALAGSGFKFSVLNKETKKIKLGLAYMFEYNEDNSIDPDIRFNIHRDQRLSSYLTLFFVISETARIASTTYFQPNINDFEDYRLSTQSSLIFDVTKKLKFTNTYSLLFDSRVPDGAPQTIQKFKSGLRYVF